VKHPANRIREHRQRAGLSTTALGDMVGLGQSAVSRIETGSNTLTIDVMYRIAAALNVLPKDLLEGSDKQSTLSIEYEDDIVNVKATLVEAKDAERLIAHLERVRERMGAEEAARKDKVVPLRSVPPKSENGGT
jgi:transcriptional regulator with XRE-family HTH domain